MGVAHEYLGAVLRRAREPMEPFGFEPDWADHPRRGKFYPGVENLGLPEGPARPEATVQQGLFGPEPTRPGTFDLPLLADMLLHSYGRLGRRLAHNANPSQASLPRYADAAWARGTASGGGLYPAAVYWVSGGAGPVLPGVYHYSTTHHTMQRLLTGDVSATVGAALGGGVGVDTDQYLVVGVKFWQNAFKYNSFAYHAVTMDVGTVVQTWRMWARAHGVAVSPALWFDEGRLSELVGVVPGDEGILAVVPLPWGPPKPPITDPAVPVLSAGRVRAVEQERSRRVRAFDTVTRVHAATLAGADRRPAPDALKNVPALPAPADEPPTVALPEPAPLDLSLRAALRTRRSSFGRFSAHLEVRPDQLAALLRAASTAGRYGCDVGPGAAGPPLAGLGVFVNHVAGVAPGVYRYDPDTNGLRLIAEGSRGRFLQRTYFLDNYNLEQAAAVIVPTVRASAVLDAVGARGYRLTNAVVGAVAQSVYTAAPALGLGCGVALGFDNVAYGEELGLAETGEAPLLIMLVGHERAMPADFRYDLV
ncbi:nitroreductase family protein [Embleya sp. AB8]|uniref:nitroreductase family protein n=1 Tax=Embleya sp. AB8 TaxID=3156304 RepID=UPI003C76AD44